MIELELEPLLVVRIQCADSLVMIWYSIVTGQQLWTTLQTWN